MDIVYYDTDRSVWVFTSCSPDTYLFEERNCVGPEVMSFETKSLDLMQLSSSAAFHVNGNKGNNRFNTTMALPAIISCNECGRQQDSSSIFSDIVSCGISGGVCSEPQEEFGFGRQCICPQGQYGALCDEYYGTSCKFLEIIPLEDIEEEPLGAQTFYDFSYTLKEDERGFGNTPIWVNEVEGYIDRIERREGLHWTITRQVTNGTDFYTIALADAVSEMDGGAATSGLTSNPQPAGLTFYAPKTTAWGTQPDYSRPFSSYQVQCKSAM